MPEPDAIVFLRESGLGSVGDTAARLLDVPAGEHDGAIIEDALRALARRAVNAEEIVEAADRLIADRDGRVVDWTWWFESPSLRLRLDVTPVTLLGERGRLWNFRDLSAKLQAIDDEYGRLHDLQEQFRVIAESATDFVFVSGPDRRIEWVTPTVTPALGWRADDLIGTNFIDLIHPDDFDRYDVMRDAIRSGAETAPPEGYVFRTRRSDDTYRWMSIRLESVRDEAGVVQRVIVGLRDIDAIVSERQAVEADRRWVRTVLDAAFDPHVVLQAVRDHDAAIVDLVMTEVNTAAAQFVRRPADELLDASAMALLADAFGSDVRDACIRVIETGEALMLDDVRVAPSTSAGPVFRVDIRVVQVGDAALLSWSDQTALYDALDATAAAEREMARRARFDELTGLANRGEFLRCLTELIDDAGHTADAAVLFCDVDRFKEINDVHGHVAGDAVLCELAGRITGMLRDTDLAARFAGDEFCVIASRIRRLDDARALAESIRAEAARPVLWNGIEIPTSLSIGITLIGSERDADAIIVAADRAMYSAKHAGRNGIATDATSPDSA